MIIRIPTPEDEIQNWLWPKLHLQPGQYMEIDIRWKNQPVIYPYQIISANGDPVKVFTQIEKTQMQRRLNIVEVCQCQNNSE